MTHGEIRGALALSAVMALVAVMAYFNRNTDGMHPSDNISGAPAIAAKRLDSITLERQAIQFELRDSMQKASRAATGKEPSSSHPRHTKTSPKKASRSKKSRQRSLPSPTPSPLDRPVK